MSEKKQVFKNLVVNVVAMGSRFLIGLWLAPYLVTHIGTAAYGFVPIAAVLTEYISIVTGAINQAIFRFLILAIQEDDWAEANRTFNTSLFSNLGLLALQVPIFALILHNLTLIFMIPPALLDDLYYLCLFHMIAYCIHMFISVLDTSMFAHNRIDLLRIKDIAGMTLRIGSIVFFFSYDEPSLVYIGLGELLAALASVVISYHYWRKLTPELAVSLRSFDRSRLQSILVMSGWLLVNYLGTLLLTRVNLFIVNRFIGAEEAGQYAAVQQWSNVVISVIIVLSFLTGPLLLNAYARRDIDKLNRIASTAMKLFGALLALVTGILIVQSKALLTVWIGEEIAALYPLLILMLVHLCATLSVSPLFTVFSAYNRVKVPGLVTLATGLGNLGLAAALAVYTDYGVYGVALSGTIMYTIREGICNPLYAARVMDKPWYNFLIPLLRCLLAFCIVVAVTLPVLLLSIDSWLELVASSAAAGLVAVPIVWLTAFNKEDRALILSLVPGSIRDRFQSNNRG